MHPHRPALTLGLKHPICPSPSGFSPHQKAMSTCRYETWTAAFFPFSITLMCRTTNTHYRRVCRPFLGTEKSTFFCIHHFDEHWTQKSFIQKSPVYQKYCFACRCSEQIKMLDRLWKNNPAWMPSHHSTTIRFWPLTESSLWFGFRLCCICWYNRDSVGLRCEILLPDLCVYL